MLDAHLLPVRNDLACLREMRPEDAHAYAAGAADAQVRTYAHLPEPEYTEASVTALIKGEIRDGLRRGDLAVLTIADPDTDAFAGSLVLFGPAEGAIEVGFWIHPAHRGRGRARAAVALSAQFARRSGFERLMARTVPENHASRRVLERAGFARGAEEREVAPSGRAAVLLHYTWDCAAAGPSVH